MLGSGIASHDDVRMKRVTSRPYREPNAFTDRIAISGGVDEGRILESVHDDMRAELARIFMMICEIWAKLDTLQNRKGGANRPTDCGV
jgi:hypothetical protein